MDTTYNSEVGVRTRRMIGLCLWAAGIVWQLLAFWLWFGYRMTTHVFYHDACMVSVVLFVVGIAFVAEASAERRGFDVERKDK